jgi:AraC-like DNA-binding protein
LNERDLLKSVRAGRERLPDGYHLPRHRHREAYAIVMVRGRLAQIGYAGRVLLETGQLLIQPVLDCHANEMVSPGADILRLPWPDVAVGGLFALHDPDAVIAAAETDPREASAIACATLGAKLEAKTDLPDELANAIACDRVDSLHAWAAERGLARETVSRAFSQAWGIDARRYRSELRARAAWLQITTTTHSLASIAQATSFADQAHMTRSVRALTGRSPGAWRKVPRWNECC